MDKNSLTGTDILTGPFYTEPDLKALNISPNLYDVSSLPLSQTYKPRGFQMKTFYGTEVVLIWMVTLITHSQNGLVKWI